MRSEICEGTKSEACQRVYNLLAAGYHSHHLTIDQGTDKAEGVENKEGDKVMHFRSTEIQHLNTR